MSNSLEVTSSNAKILIVEDDKFLRELLVHKLEIEGFKTLVAIEGDEALKKVREEIPSIILLDLVLPGMSGFEVLEKIKKDDQLKKIPVIILSNLGQKEEVSKGIQLGAEDYLIKAHFTPDEIVQKVKDTLNKQRTGQ